MNQGYYFGEACDFSSVDEYNEFFNIYKSNYRLIKCIR